MFESFRSEPPEKVESHEEVFAKHKKEVADFLEKVIEADDTEIDIGIFDLVLKLNSLPFLYTSIGSCQGHLRQRPNSTHARFTPGYLNLEVDDSDDAQRFIDAVTQIVSRHPHARINDNRTNPVWGGLEVLFYDPGKSYHVMLPKEEAVEADADGKKIIKELESLVDDFKKETKN